MKPSKNNIINDYTKYQKLPSDFELNSSNNFMPREAREAIIAVSLCCFFFLIISIGTCLRWVEKSYIKKSSFPLSNSYKTLCLILLAIIPLLFG